MVSVDDPYLLVRFVRDCFITGDDSGFCETLFNWNINLEDPELSSLSPETFQFPIVDTEEDVFARYSPECPYVDHADVPTFENDLQSSHPHSEWRNIRPTAGKVRSLTGDEIETYFPLTPASAPAIGIHTGEVKKSSLLTAALEQAKADGRLQRSSLFADFAVHDGRSIDPECASPASNLRSFNVWFWRVTDFPRTSLCVQPCRGTTVRQFVGLTLWQYFNGTLPADSILLQQLDRFDNSFVDRLMVYVCDSLDDEEADSELPPLEPTDQIHKYQFDTLALVERSDAVSVGLADAETMLLVTIHLAQGFSTYRFSANTPLSAVLERVVARRHLRQHDGLEYRLESLPAQAIDPTGSVRQNAPSTTTGQRLPGQRLKPDLRLCDVVAAGLPLRFALVRDNSRFDPACVDAFDKDESPEPESQQASNQLTAALQLRQYRVSWLKGLSSREVQLELSPEGIQIVHVTTMRRPKLFSKPKPVLTLDLHVLADCELITPASASIRSNRSMSDSGPPSRDSPTAATRGLSGKVRLRIVYLTNDSSLPGTVDPALPACPVDADSGQVFHQLFFETQWARATAIRDQLILTLECCGSRARRLYMQRRLAN